MAQEAFLSPFTLLAFFLIPFTTFQLYSNMESSPKWTINNLCVFCGSSYPKDARHEAGAQNLAKEMVKRNIGLVYGGGTRGMMGIIGKNVFEGA